VITVLNEDGEDVEEINSEGNPVEAWFLPGFGIDEDFRSYITIYNDWKIFGGFAHSGGSAEQPMQHPIIIKLFSQLDAAIEKPK
jgi:hypothetical protein